MITNYQPSTVANIIKTTVEIGPDLVRVPVPAQTKN